MRERLFSKLTRLVENHPWLVLTTALIIALAAAAAARDLKMETRILDLLPREDPAALEFNEIVRQYDSASQIMIGVEGGTREQKIAFAEKFGRKVSAPRYTCRKDGKKRPYLKRADIKSDVEFIQEHGLMLTKKRDLQNLEELFAHLELPDFLVAYNDFLEREYIEDTGALTEREKEDNAIDGLKALVEFLNGVTVAVEKPDSLRAHAEHATDLLSTGDPYLFSQDDSMLVFSAVPAVSVDSMDETMEGVADLRRVLNEIQKDYPNLSFRMTGLPVLALEEGEVAMGDMGISSIVSLVLVLALFVLAFRMWTAPILAVINLLIGIIWTSGFVALTLGRLNLMTLMFAVILIGLGIDFAIHLNASYSTARAKGLPPCEALQEMYRQSGAGVITGAITTSAAFFALTFTGLDAFVELGLLLGTGIVLTLVSSMVVLPAMYIIHERVAARVRGKQTRKVKPGRLGFPFLERFGTLIVKRPIIIAASVIALTGLAAFFASDAEFENDMMNMEPPDMPSVTLHREILKKFEINPDYTMVTASNLDEARKITKTVKKNRLVGMVDSLSDLVPSEKQQKKRAKHAKRISRRMSEYLDPDITVGVGAIPAIADLPEYLTTEEIGEKRMEVVYAQLDRLHKNVDEIGQSAFAAVKNRLYDGCMRLTGNGDIRFSQILGIKDRIKELSRPGKAVAEYQREYIPLLAAKLEKMADTSSITVENLPSDIRERYLSKDGNNLVTIYSSVDLYQDDKLELFVKATSKVSDRVTGTAILMDRLIELVGENGLMAIFFALGAVFLILLIDFRHIGYALLGMVPLVTGFAWMIGIFVLLGWKFDVVNVGAIPLILGIGIDDAVHVLHAVRREGVPGTPRILKHTGRALVLTSLTTAIAFGSIAFASHVGMAGMGLILVLGVASCLVTSLVLLPALARIILGTRESETTDKEVQYD